MALVLDADVLSDILRKRRKAYDRLRRALSAGEVVYMSPVAYYEVLRGLLHKRAREEVEFLRNLCLSLEWNDFSRPVWEEAAKLWADCRTAGHSLSDERRLEGDALIAAHARSLDATVATRNVKHFRFLGVEFEDWN